MVAPFFFEDGAWQIFTKVGRASFMSILQKTEEHVVEELLLPVLDHLSNGHLDIPMLPHVASQVLLLANNPEGNATKLGALIQQDQVLACRVLQLANSAAYGSRYPIESLPQAISWLGLNFLAGTAFSFSVQSGVFNVDGYEKEVQGLWAYTLTVALYGKAIAGELGLNPENAFLCGLLHAIGKPYVTHTVNFHQRSSDVRHPWPVLDRVIRESYVEAGRQLAVAWELPESVREAIMLHEDCACEKATSPVKGAAITCLARHLANSILSSDVVDEQQITALPVAQLLGVSQSHVASWLDMRESIQANVAPMVI